MINMHRLLRPCFFLAGIVLLPACTSYGDINNKKLESESDASYSISKVIRAQRSNETTVVLAFSGGGSRAAALAYGVLDGLRQTHINIDGGSRRLLDEVDAISSVSGGSFTAAYFGLYGDQVFTDFEHAFLRRDVTGELIYGLFNPLMWFSSRGRTEMAVEFYEKSVFNGATFADMQRQDGPLIVINATDMGGGMRFSFLQEYFDLLCSDLSSFPVARAVTASSAVPVLFNPVVLQNHAGCETTTVSWLNGNNHSAPRSPQLKKAINGLKSYAEKDRRQYIHLVDGGITDNLGLLAIYEMVEVAGGARKFLDAIGARPAPHFLVISVNASASPQYDIESTNEIPAIEDTVNAVSDIQVHRSNATTQEQFQQGMKRWVAELAEVVNEQAIEGKGVTPYFVEIDFNGIPQNSRRLFFNQIPTNYSLNKEQVDHLINAGRELLFNHPEYQRYIDNMGW